jgi:predicted esterase
LRVFIAHGKRDPSVRMVKSHEIRDNLIGCGLSVTHHEFDDGHTMPPDVVRMAWEWMKKI